MENYTKRNPVKGENLRQAGDSLLDGMFKEMAYLLAVLLVFAFLVGLTVHEFMYKYTNSTPKPYLLLSITVIYSVFAWIYKNKQILKIENYSLGRRGERYVSVKLNELIKQDAHIINDIPMEYDNKNKFNIDHVIVSHRGVFAIETKTWRKGLGEDSAKLKYENGKLVKTLGNIYVDNDGISESETHAEKLATLIYNRTGLNVKVTPVVLLPKWYIEKEYIDKMWDERKVYVANPDYFVKVYEGSDKSMISDDDVAKINTSLNNYVVEYLDKEI